jgi:hypothetical protein
MDTYNNTERKRMNVILILLGIVTLVAAGYLLKSPEDDE